MSLRRPGPAPRAALAAPTAPGARCEIGDAMRLASKAHVIDVLHLLGRSDRPLRFNELRASTRANANVLAMRLRDLVDARLVQRGPDGAGYAATAHGRALLQALEPVRTWSLAPAAP